MGDHLKCENQLTLIYTYIYRWTINERGFYDLILYIDIVLCIYSLYIPGIGVIFHSFLPVFAPSVAII